MLELNSGARGPILSFPRGDANTHAHSLWMSNLFVDLTRTGPNLALASHESYLNAAVTDHQPIIANILLIWDMFMGGHVEEETFWAVDKSYAVVLLSFFSCVLNVMCASNSLGTILSHLSIRVTNGIADRSCLHHLIYLLEFLAAWEKRPTYLTAMAYQWCSTISEAAGRLDPSEISVNLPHTLQYILEYQLRPREVGTRMTERGFSEVGPGRDPVHLDATPHHSRGRPQHLTPPIYAHLLLIILKIGFRRDQSVYLDCTSHHEWVFETAFSSDDDEVIADAVCIWIACGPVKLPDSCARYLAKRVEDDTLFSPRLRQANIRTIGRFWRNELNVSGSDTVRWLNRLNIDADDADDAMGEIRWIWLLIEVIRSTAGLETLSSHYWHSLDKLFVVERYFLDLESRDAEVMRSLEKAEDWERLTVWMVIVWSSFPTSESMEGFEEVTLKLLLRRPSALPRFEDLCEAGTPAYPLPAFRALKRKLQRICNQVRAEQLPSESPPP